MPTNPSPVLRPLKAIRAKCLDCSCHQTKEVRLCTHETCPLWPYRMGKRPKGQDSHHSVMQQFREKTIT